MRRCARPNIPARFAGLAGVLGLALAVLALLGAPGLLGCAGPEPWERSAFARPHVDGDGDADDPAATLREHVYRSREGTTPAGGGGGTGGGGCGCY